MPPPSLAVLAIAFLEGGVLQSELGRKAIAALLALAVAAATLPPGRRRLASWPLTLLCLAPLPFFAALLFPESVDGGTLAVDGARFFLLASILQSLLLVVAVSAWERFAKPWPTIFLDVFRWLLVAAAFVAILYESGVNAGNLFTGSALVTAALGFALKDTLGNVFSGLAIHAEHPFEVGDWIQYDQNQAHIGRVVEINWRATKVITLDEAYVIIPNGQLAQASIRNFTKPEPWMCHTKASTGSAQYSSSLPRRAARAASRCLWASRTRARAATCTSARGQRRPRRRRAEA
jgi:small-conductance mechanosensitive channel